MLRTFFFSIVLSGLLWGQNLNEPAPNFTLTDLQGNQHTLADYKGKVVYIFWFGYS